MLLFGFLDCVVGHVTNNNDHSNSSDRRRKPNIFKPLRRTRSSFNVTANSIERGEDQLFLLNYLGVGIDSHWKSLRPKHWLP